MGFGAPSLLNSMGTRYRDAGSTPDPVKKGPDPREDAEPTPVRPRFHASLFRVRAMRKRSSSGGGLRSSAAFGSLMSFRSSGFS